MKAARALELLQKGWVDMQPLGDAETAEIAGVAFPDEPGLFTVARVGGVSALVACMQNFAYSTKYLEAVVQEGLRALPSVPQIR